VTLARQELLLGTVGLEQVRDGAVAEEGMLEEEVGRGAGMVQQHVSADSAACRARHARRVRHGPRPACLRPHELVVADARPVTLSRQVKTPPRSTSARAARRGARMLEVIAVEGAQGAPVEGGHDILQKARTRSRRRSAERRPGAAA
jgi:hypothetical protein